MKEIMASDLNVGDVVYNPIWINAGWTNIGTYYRKEVVKRITPKRTKVVTDHGEYKTYYRFYEYSEEIETINKQTDCKKKIYDSAYTLDKLISKEKVYLDMPEDKILRLSKLLGKAIDILKGEEDK